jgi:hypothetical protein
MRAATRILVVASFLILSATSLRPGFEPWIHSLNTQFHLILSSERLFKFIIVLLDCCSVYFKLYSDSLVRDGFSSCKEILRFLLEAQESQLLITYTI